MSTPLLEVRGVKVRIVRAIGIDPSLRCTALVALDFDFEKRTIRLGGAGLVQPRADIPIGERLSNLSEGFMDQLRAIDAKGAVYCMEGLSRGSRFMREEAGMVYGLIAMSVWNWRTVQPEIVTPAEVKRVACPAWPGFGLKHWAAAGRTTKFKRSMPDKVSVISGLYRRFGIRLENEHCADAACVAIGGVCRRVGLNYEVLAAG